MKVTRFTTINDQKAIRVVTASGVTGYVDTAIPPEALEAWRRRLIARLKPTISPLRRNVRRQRRRVRVSARQHARRPRRNLRMNLHKRRIPLIRRR